MSRILAVGQGHVVMPHFEKLAVEIFVMLKSLLDELEWRRTGPASMDSMLRVVIILRIIFRPGETDGCKTGYIFWTQIFVDFDGSDVSHYELTVLLSPRNVVVRVDSNIPDLQNYIEVLATLLGRVVPRLELHTDDLSVLSSHDLRTRIGPTVNTSVSRAVRSTDVFTATTWPRLPVSFTQEDTVSGRHHDEGARGAGQDGGAAVVLIGEFGS